MKSIITNKLLLIIACLILGINLFAQQSSVSYAPDGKSGSLTLLASDCQFDDWNYSFEIDIPINQPVKITLTANTYDGIDIWNYNGFYNYLGNPSVLNKLIISTDGKLYINAWDGYYGLPTGNVFTFTFAIDVASSLTASSGYVPGYFGIGTPTPRRKLEIVEGIGGRFTFSGINCNSGYEIAQTVDDTGSKLNIGTTVRDYRIAINGSDKFTIGTSGNVGIGSTYPQAGLHVIKTSSINGNNVAAILGNNYNHWTYFGGTTGGRIRGANDGYLVLESNPNGTGDKNLYLNFQSTSNILMALGGGNVGIGAAPSSENKLEVAGRLKINGDIYGSDILTFQNDARFTVSQTTIPNLIPSSFSMPQYGLAAPGTTGSADLWMSGHNGIKLFTDGNAIPRFAIAKDGKVSIGTIDADATPNVLLTVKGTIHAKEVLIDLNAPLADFVFSPDYTLMPLNKVEAFVKTNKHLPEIPSAAEVKEKGLNMGEMQNKLLQKIEELTLYVIEQQKELQMQRAEIDELKRK